ncbi:MAG TPA: Crp/Fnr family transcriptional regulator [Draconibacterium sp.]|nr:Crp/Fnr family transcriptional regulator [Draconibacterium sp.]
MIPIDLENYADYISDFYLFVTSTSAVSATSWQATCNIMNYRMMKKGERLLDYMKVESAVRFLTKGIVKCEDHFNEKSFVYDFRVAPIILCETVSFFNTIPSRITLEAVTDCEFIELPRVPFVKILFSHLDLAEFATKGVANYLGMTHYKQALLRTLDAEQRYKHFLKEFPGVALKAKLSDIASYIDVTQQSLSRLRKEITWGKEELELEALSNELALVHGISF